MLLSVSCTKKEPTSVELQSFFYHILLNDIEEVDKLLEDGLDPNVQNDDGLTALHYAIFIEHFEIADLLIKHGANYEYSKVKDNRMLIDAVFRGASDTARLMISKGGYDLNALGPLEWPPLLEAIRFGHTEIVEMLLEAEVEVNFQDTNGWTALHEAAYSGFDEIIELLLLSGADVSVKNERGFTPLHVATLGGYSNSVKMLVEHGSNVNELDDHKRSPLHIAAEQGFYEVVLLLLEYGAERHLVNEDDKTPLQMAEEWGHTQIIQILK